MSSWTFETFEMPHNLYPEWTISASYRWNKGAPYSVFVGVFNKEGVELWCIFKNTYGDAQSAKRAFKRQVKKLKSGNY